MEVEEKVIAQDQLEKALGSLDELLKPVVETPKEEKPVVEKSFAEVAKESDEIEKSMDVAPFLAEVVNAIGTHLDGLTASLNEKLQKSQEAQKTAQGTFNEALVKSLQEMGAALLTITKRQEELEKEPVGVKKSITAQPVERQFAKSGEEEGEKRLSKAQVTDKLVDMVLKSEYVGGIPVTQTEVTKFETTGQLRPELKEHLLKG